MGKMCGAEIRIGFVRHSDDRNWDLDDVDSSNEELMGKALADVVSSGSSLGLMYVSSVYLGVESVGT